MDKISNNQPSTCCGLMKHFLPHLGIPSSPQRFYFFGIQGEAFSIMTKTCNTCKQDKQFDQFYKDKSNKTGLSTQCKQCEAARKRGYYKKNRDKMLADNKTWLENNTKSRKEYSKAYYKENKEACQKRTREWQINNQDKVRSYNKRYKTKRAEYVKHRRTNDPQFKLILNMRRRMNHCLDGNRKPETTMALLGCTLEQLQQHLESQFTRGMSWDNYGLYGWHVDHIKPCSSFDHTDPEQVKQCWHYTNLQPLWAEDNLAKSDKII